MAVRCDGTFSFFSFPVYFLFMIIAGGSYVGQKGTVLGWGITSFPSGDPSLTLQKLAVEVLSNFQCSRVIDDHVGLGMLCAAAPALQGTCFVSLTK